VDSSGSFISWQKRRMLGGIGRIVDAMPFFSPLFSPLFPPSLSAIVSNASMREGNPAPFPLSLGARKVEVVQIRQRRLRVPPLSFLFPPFSFRRRCQRPGNVVDALDQTVYST